jgi:hypothetical protein
MDATLKNHEKDIHPQEKVEIEVVCKGAKKKP